MRNIARRLIPVLAVLLSGQAYGEKIVIPVFLAGGASTGGWGMVGAIENRSSTAVTAEGAAFTTLLDCPIPEGCPDAEVPPRTAGLILGPNAAAGLMLEAEDRAHVSISVRVFRSPSGLKVAGAELPIAGESDFRAQPFHFPFVPLGGAAARGLRVHLRVYSLDQEPVRVRVESRSFWSMESPPADSIELELLPQAPPSPPRFLFADLVAYLPGAFGRGDQTVSVVPLPGAEGPLPRIWAFISLTSPGDEIAILKP